MNLKELIAKLPRTSKKDEIPGSVEKELDELCPACMKVKLAQYKPCCGAPKGYIKCRACGYKILPE